VDQERHFAQLVGVLPGMVAAEEQFAFSELDLNVGLSPAAIASIGFGETRALRC
jgi:hypothetical protein